MTTFFQPIIVGNHAITVQAKESKKAAKPTSLAVGSLSGAIGDPSVGSSSSAYGLSDISLSDSAEVNKSAVNTLSTPTLHQPATLTVTKPKFQVSHKIFHSITPVQYTFKTK